MALSSLLYNQVIHCIFNHYGNICYKERKKIEKNFTFIHIQNPIRLTLIKLWCGNIFFFQPNKTKQNRKNHYQDRKSYLQINLSLINDNRYHNNPMRIVKLNQINRVFIFLLWIVPKENFVNSIVHKTHMCQWLIDYIVSWLLWRNTPYIHEHNKINI